MTRHMTRHMTHHMTRHVTRHVTLHVTHHVIPDEELGYTLNRLFLFASLRTTRLIFNTGCLSNYLAPAIVRLSPPTGVVAVAEDYPLVHVVKETITGRWSGDGDQVPLT